MSYQRTTLFIREFSSEAIPKERPKGARSDWENHVDLWKAIKENARGKDGSTYSDERAWAATYRIIDEGDFKPSRLPTEMSRKEFEPPMRTGGGGHWVTTEGDHKIYINKSGEIAKGNPHVIKAINTHHAKRDEALRDIDNGENPSYGGANTHVPLLSKKKFDPKKSSGMQNIHETVLDEQKEHARIKYRQEHSKYLREKTRLGEWFRGDASPEEGTPEFEKLVNDEANRTLPLAIKQRSAEEARKGLAADFAAKVAAEGSSTQKTAEDFRAKSPNGPVAKTPVVGPVQMRIYPTREATGIAPKFLPSRERDFEKGEKLALVGNHLGKNGEPEKYAKGDIFESGTMPRTGVPAGNPVDEHGNRITTPLGVHGSAHWVVVEAKPGFVDGDSERGRTHKQALLLRYATDADHAGVAGKVKAIQDKSDADKAHEGEMKAKYGPYWKE